MLNDLLAQIELLSDTDKRTLIAETMRMLPAQENGLSAPKVLAEVALADAYIATPTVATSKRQSEEAYLAEFRTEIEELLARPNPTPDQMMTYGLFEGRLDLDEEDFKAAEWNPSDEELENAGLSVHH